MRFSIVGLQAYRLRKLRLRCAKISGLKLHQPKIIVSLREIRVSPDEFTEYIGRAVTILVLIED